MTHKLPWMLLTLSLVFNFFFAGGFFEARSTGDQVQAEDGTQVVAQRLGLSDEQSRAYVQLRDDMAAKARQARESIFAARQELWGAVSGDLADPRRTQDLIEFEAEQTQQLRLQMAEHLGSFMRILNPQQRRTLMEAIQRREATHPFAGQAFQRFDANRDGKLDDQERAAVRERLGSRLPEIQRMRQRLLDRFDTDDDGKLSPEERQEALKAMENWKANSHAPARP